MKQSENKRWLIGVLVVVVALVVIGAVSHGGTSNKPPLTYCSALSDLGDTAGRASAGTLTTAEFIDKLASIENDLEGAALLFDDPNEAAQVRTLADAVGRLKVAASSGGGFNAALDDLNSTLDSVPHCS